jgi:nitrite reductase/ring-hydroxylating ferredoxin subunit
MKKIILISFLLIVAYSHGQTFEITDGQSMCMIGKGKGQGRNY